MAQPQQICEIVTEVRRGEPCTSEQVEQVGDIQSEKKPAADVGKMSFEQALKELEGIVGRLEQGEVDLEDSIALYERGQTLKNHCEARLKAAEGRLEKLVLGASGGPVGSEVVETV
jgi:exodeoxyribonuclease VII small subunit